MKIAYIKKDELAVATGRDPDKIHIALSSLEGKNHHDWLIEFPKLIGIGYEQCIAYLFELGMSDETFRSNAEVAWKELFDQISKAYD